MKKLLALLVFALMSQAYAYDLTSQFGLGVSGGYPIPVFGNAFNTAADAKWQAGVHARYHFSPSLNVELGASRSKFKDTTLKFTNYDLLGVWRMAGSSDVTPVLGAGLAMTKISNYVSGSMKLSALARLGMEFGLTSQLSLSAFADYQYVSKLMGAMETGRAHVVTPQLALTWYFGSNSKKSEAQPAQVLEEKVAEKKEELKEKVAAAAATVTDTDGDGVLGMDDKCPNSKAGETVNAYGCAVDEKAQIQINVEFASGKSVVDSKYDSHLNEVAEFFKKYPQVKAQIAGYTDNQGSVAGNTNLSQKRAEAVRNYLVKLGVEKTRLNAKGFGPKDPVAENTTDEGRARNRRVIAVVTE